MKTLRSIFFPLPRQTFAFPYTVPYLYPTTNVMMTCSIYMTAAVGVNRYLDIIDFSPRIRSGFYQAVIVFSLAAAVNGPRWREFEFVHVPAHNVSEFGDDDAEVSLNKVNYEI